MNTAWDRQFFFSWGRIDVIFDLCDLMVGIAWGEADVVIKPIPCLIVCIEWDLAE